MEKRGKYQHTLAPTLKNFLKLFWKTSGWLGYVKLSSIKTKLFFIRNDIKWNFSDTDTTFYKGSAVVVS